MKITLESEPDDMTGKLKYIIRKDGSCVAVKFTESEANETFEKFVETQRELIKVERTKLIREVEI